MAKDDFDLNFDFEKEFGLDPSSYLSSDEEEAEFDYSEFSDQELGLTDHNDTPPAAEEDSFDLDMDQLDALLNGGEAAPAAKKPAPEEDLPGDFSDDFLKDFSDFQDNDDAAEMVARKNQQSTKKADMFEPPLFDKSGPSISFREPDPEAPAFDSGEPEEPMEPAEPQKPRRKVREPREPKEPKAPKEPMKPNIFTKFFDLYFGPVLHKEQQQEPQPASGNPRRRKKTKMQIFKEVYLPPIVLCLAMILIMSMVIGAVTHSIRQKQMEDAALQSQLESSKSAEELAAMQLEQVKMEASQLAASYYYQEAINTLDDFLKTVDDQATYSEITALRSSFVQEKDQLVEYMDPTTIPNLSFHPLMVDPARAFMDSEQGRNYNRNFVSVAEFNKLLTILYNSGYVLVDFDSITTKNGDQMFPQSIYLPQGKKPFMITETLVNYFAYMINDDGGTGPNANGDGFANKLVLDDDGNIKAAYTDSNGMTQIGDYDLVPILEAFIEDHPDFAYQGARAILAVCGYEGIFGYRINSSYRGNHGDIFVDNEIAGAKEIVQALRDAGYTMACYTFENVDYNKKNANQIMADLNKWTTDITPVIGDVDILVAAKNASLPDNGASFTVIRDKGYRYLISDGDEPAGILQQNKGYMLQDRLMVTGNSLFWKKSMFDGIFDPDAFRDDTTRGDIPN